MKHVSQKVFVGISGGVDSSVSAALLKKAGYDVTGVFIKVWFPDWISSGCDPRVERRDAMRVCAELGIPFMTLDLEDVYKKEVVDYLIETYSKGETPNPDVMCNRYVKFGAFWDFARAHGADYIATGHYAQNIQTEQGTYELRAGSDAGKDQTYFLYTLTQKDLAHVLFPIGHLQKKEVRALATSYNLPTAQKKDSQGLCFLGDVSIKDLLSHYVDIQKGDVLDTKGSVIGEHEGALLYTLGQRHGFKLHNTLSNSHSQYVVSKDIANNTITVSSTKSIPQSITTLTLENFTYTTSVPPSGDMVCRLRYRGTLLPCTLGDAHDSTAHITYTQDISNEFPASGQSVVLYKDGVCLGGGIIKT